MQDKNENRKFSRYEWNEICDELENHHSIFSKFWQLGAPVFTDKIPTAAVVFDKIGSCIEFMINPEFWDSLSMERKIFVICHECMHVILYHGHRTCKIKNKQEHQIANLALDIVVNHSLLEILNGKREVFDPENIFCWVDTVFPENTPPVGESFEFYYNLIKKEIQENSKSQAGKMSSMDDHQGLESFADESFDEFMKDSMDKSDQESFKDSKMQEMAKEELAEQNKKEKKAGDGAGKTWIQVNFPRVLPKRKWETIIKSWSKKYLDEKWDDQWSKPNRRTMSLPKDFLLPSENETDEFEKRRIEVNFYLDTSGSCQHLAERFFKAAASLPEDRFDINLFCFDTQVYETNLKDKKLYGFGGTAFDIIEKHIQSEMKKDKKSYPEAVFVITDGFGNKVNPEMPKKWHWFLSEDYKSCIPKDSKIFMLKDFE